MLKPPNTGWCIELSPRVTLIWMAQLWIVQLWKAQYNSICNWICIETADCSYGRAMLLQKGTKNTLCQPHYEIHIETYPSACNLPSLGAGEKCEYPWVCVTQTSGASPIWGWGWVWGDWWGVFPLESSIRSHGHYVIEAASSFSLHAPQPLMPLASFPSFIHTSHKSHSHLIYAWTMPFFNAALGFSDSCQEERLQSQDTFKFGWSNPVMHVTIYKWIVLIWPCHIPKS